MLEITEKRPEDIKEQEQLFQNFEEHPFKKKFDVLADVKTSYYFGNKFSKTQYEKLLNAFRSGENEWKKVTQEDWVKKASDSVSEKVEENLSDEKKFFHWKLEFPEVFFNIKGDIEKPSPGFDIVLGNPPYVRSRNLKKEDRNYFKEAFKTTHRTFDIYIPFLEKSLKLTKKKGSFSFILPRSYLNQPYARLNRELNLNQCKISSILDLFNVEVFEDAEIINCVPIFRKEAPDDHLVEVRKYKNGNFMTETTFPQEFYLSHPFLMLKTDISLEDAEIAEKLEANTEKLSKLFYLLKGVEVYERGSGKTKEEFLYSSKDEGGENLKPYIEGKDIERYGINPRGLYLSYQPERHCSGKFPELFENEKILIKRIIGKDSGLSCVVDLDDYYAENTTICCLRKFDLRESENVKFTEGIKESKETSLFSVCAILNSELLTYYYFTMFGDKLQTYVKYLNRLPMKLRGIKKTNEITQKLDKISREIHSKKRKKHDEISSFLKWISYEWSCGLEELSLKTHLREYWIYDFDEMLRIAKKNKSKIEGNPSSRKFQEKLEKEWQASVDKLKPLMEEIQDLENQIDALIFKLYELDKEEVITVLESLDTREEVKEDILEKL